MLESLFNNNAGLQDCCKTYLLHAPLRFYFSLAKTFKNVLNSIELLSGSIFSQNAPFRAKTYNSENLGRISLLLTMEHFFFWKFEIRNEMASSIKVF